MERRRLLLLVYLIILRMKRRRRAKENRFWVRELFKTRDEKRAYTQILQQIRLKTEKVHI